MTGALAGSSPMSIVPHTAVINQNNSGERLNHLDYLGQVTAVLQNIYFNMVLSLSERK